MDKFLLNSNSETEKLILEVFLSNFIKFRMYILTYIYIGYKGYNPITIDNNLQNLKINY